MSEEIKVDIEKYDEERRKKIIESGHYLEFYFLIGDDENGINEPICEMKGNASNEMIGELLIGLEQSLEIFKNEYKNEYLIAKLTKKLESKVINMKEEKRN